MHAQMAEQQQHLKRSRGSLVASDGAAVPVFRDASHNHCKKFHSSVEILCHRSLSNNQISNIDELMFTGLSDLQQLYVIEECCDNQRFMYYNFVVPFTTLI